MSSKPKIALCMICKNESHIIRECLASMAKHIDYWVICDTGSTDGTQDIIRQFFAEAGIPGELHQHEWSDFGTNRSLAISLCDGKADYAWMIDADDYVRGDFKYPEVMDADAYTLRISRGTFVWWRNQIFKTGCGWCYIGKLHEYAHCCKPNPIVKKMEGDYAVEARTLGGRNVGITPQEKYAKDAILLEKEMLIDPENSRNQFYLAQSYFDSHQWQKASDAYAKRAKMGGWEEEIYYSLFRVAVCGVIMQKDWLQVQQDFMAAWSFRPIRAEPLYELSRLYRAANQPRLAYMFARLASTLPFPAWDILFIEPDVYNWKVLDELSATAWSVHDFVSGVNACKHLLASPHLPIGERDRVLANLKSYEEGIQKGNFDKPGVMPLHRPWMPVIPQIEVYNGYWTTALQGMSRPTGNGPNPSVPPQSTLGTKLINDMVPRDKKKHKKYKQRVR